MFRRYTDITNSLPRQLTASKCRSGHSGVRDNSAWHSVSIDDLFLQELDDETCSCRWNWNSLISQTGNMYKTTHTHAHSPENITPVLTRGSRKHEAWDSSGELPRERSLCLCPIQRILQPAKTSACFRPQGGGVQIFMSTSVHLAPDGASTISASAQLITDTYAYVVHKDICKGVKL